MQRDINTIPYVYAKVNEIVTDCLLLEKIRINYTRKMRINLLLPRMGKKITGIRLSPNTRYRVYRPRLIDYFEKRGIFTDDWLNLDGRYAMMKNNFSGLDDRDIRKFGLTDEKIS